MAGTIRMSILANARQARAEVSGFADHTEKSTGRIRDTLSRAGKAVALGLGAGLVGAAAAGVKFAQAAIEDEKSAAKMANTFRNAAGATKGQIAATESWITAQGKALGVADDDLRPALSRLVTATGDVGQAQKLTSLAMDVSAGSGKSLESVSTALMKAQNGQVSALSRLGINTKNAAGDTITMEQATKRMADTFGGAAASNADTLGGRVERLKLMASEAGESIGAKMLPLLTTFAAWVISTGIPAITNIATTVQTWAAGMRDRLAPVISAVSAFVTGTLVPAISAFAGYVVGTVVPAVVAFATKIGGNLRPVLDAVIGVVAKVIAKFREWGPTIATVISVVAKIVAKVAEFASVILGTVLPPLIRFAGAIATTLGGAIVTAVGIVAKIISKVAEFGGAVIDGARKVGEFAAKVGDKISDVVGFFTDLPGKIRGALSGAGTMLTNIGQNIVQGLIDGIDSARQWIIDKVAALGNLIPGWLKRKLGIASPSKVTHKIGEQAGQGLANGISAKAGAVKAAAGKSAEKLVEAIQRKIDNAKGVKDSITSLRDSIAGALTGDLFGGRDDESGSALSKFRAGLEAARATAEKVRAATADLIGKGVSSKFLQSLTSSGNTDLIVQLSGAADAAALAKEYEAVLTVNAETGLAVAENVIGTRLDDVNKTLADLATEMKDAEKRARDERKAERAADKAEHKSEREQDREERKKGLRMEVEITASGIDDISSGRRYKRAIKAFENAGGR